MPKIVSQDWHFNSLPCQTRRRSSSATRGRVASVALPAALLGLAACVLIVCGNPRIRAAEEASAENAEATSIEARLAATVGTLAADEMEGRGVGTAGLNAAAEFIAQQFAALNLVTDSYQGRPFQEFSMTVGAELGATNELRLVGPPDAAGQPQTIELKLETDFVPLALGGSGRIDLPMVFAGYGITAKDADYDDYAGLDVQGKAVLLLRHEPQQDNPHSAFNGTRHSPHAPFSRKLANAYEHGAAAVIFCTDEHEIREKVTRRAKRWQEALDSLKDDLATTPGPEPSSLADLQAFQQKIETRWKHVHEEGEKLSSEYDPLLKFDTAGDEAQGRDFPALHSRRAPWNTVLAQVAGTDLAALERAIDEKPAPQSRELTGWRLQGEVTVVHREVPVKNVVAVLPGEGPLAEQTIVIGAHYDHLGHGGSGSLAPGSQEIHNGADDNASGTAALIEVARLLATRPEKLPRRIVFIAFTGEERGLIGSARYVREPLIPLEKTVAMLNMDMVGRLNDEKLVVYGTGTAPEFDPLLDQLNERYGFKISRQPGGFGPSDHSSFYAKRIPVLHFFTGTHADYHRPSDDIEKLNLEGMRRVGQMVAEIAIELAQAENPPLYVETSAASSSLGGDGERPYFGSVPDFSQEQPGYALMSVTKDGPADRAGLQGGDVIIRLGESQIGSLEDFDSALRKYKAGDKVPVTVRRNGQEVVVEVTLDPPR